MKEENLYDAINHRKGKIVVKMEDDKFYTFELTKNYNRIAWVTR